MGDDTPSHRDERSQVRREATNVARHEGSEQSSRRWRHTYRRLIALFYSQGCLPVFPMHNVDILPEALPYTRLSTHSFTGCA